MIRPAARSLSRDVTARVLILALIAGLATLLSACAPQSAEEKVAAARGQYTVELKSWFPREPAPPEGEASAEDVAAEGEVAEGEAAEGEAGEGEAAAGEAAGVEGEATADASADGGEGEEGMQEGEVAAEPAGPRTVNIFFDLIANFRGNDPMTGFTLDISQADAGGSEKKAWRRYVELPRHLNGETFQISFLSEGVEFTDGDQFSVVLETAITAEERAEYREFVEAAP